MAAKKAPSKTSAPEVEEIENEVPEPTAEEVREAELDDEDLLADLPKLRAPERLRVRHKTHIKSIGYRYIERVKKLGVKPDEDGNTVVTVDQMFTMLDLAAELDDFAESIAEDPAAYERWAEENSDNVAVFFALLNRYQGALGESTGSAS